MVDENLQVGEKKKFHKMCYGGRIDLLSRDLFELSKFTKRCTIAVICAYCKTIKGTISKSYQITICRTNEATVTDAITISNSQTYINAFKYTK